MPVHDWSRVESDLFHHFGRAWTAALCDVLNGGTLPRGYSALLQRRRKLAPSSSRNERPLQTGVIFPTAPRGDRIVIRHRVGEVVSISATVRKSGRIPGRRTRNDEHRRPIMRWRGLVFAEVGAAETDAFSPARATFRPA
jgi:hypothetical protein